MMPGSEVAPTVTPQDYLLAMTDRDRRALAMKILDRHRDGKKKRRLRDLTAEKYLLHVDGTADGQYAEIWNGQEVFVLPKLSGTLRLQHNLLRPLMDNMVAYHTANPLKVVAETSPGRRARDRARLDSMLGNHTILDQRLNLKLAEAMFVAGIYGSCPVHVTWRMADEDEFLNPLYASEGKPDGYVDVWVGDPWDTVYNDGATRENVMRVSYGRTVPIERIQGAFQGLPWVDKIKGSDQLPSASRFQKIARRWEYQNQFFNAGTVIRGGYQNDEMVAIVCEEILPGVDPEWPDGRLAIVALSGAAETEPYRQSGSTDNVELLHLGPLPCRRFSMVRFYTSTRMDDVLGKPYVSDLDDLQVQLNDLYTMRAERLRKFAKPKLAVQYGSVDDDEQLSDPDRVIHFSGEKPSYLDVPNMTVSEFDLQIEKIEGDMFRIGGWQAASRGESNAGDPAAKVVALSKADDTVFGPMNRQFQESTTELLALAHCFVRTFAGRPFIAKVSGEDFAYAVDPWINTDRLSYDDPKYRLVNGFGATPDALAQTLAQLVVVKTADGQPLMTRDEFWEKYPDPAIRPHTPNLRATKQRRLAEINYFIEQVSEEVATQNEALVRSNPNQLQTLVQVTFDELMRRYPIERTDDIQMCLEYLDEIVHDTTVSGIARSIARMRQQKYFEWLAMQMQAQAPGGQPPRTAQPDPSSSGTPPRMSSPFGGTRTSDAMSPERTKQEVRSLTAAASSGEMN